MATAFGSAWLTRRSLLTDRKVSGILRLVEANQADCWAALGDSTRRAIFERLGDRPQSVGQLAAQLPISRPAVSQHLKVLKRAGLVLDRSEGTRRIYRVDPAGIHALRSQLDRFWTRALAAYKTAAEQPMEEEG